MINYLNKHFSFIYIYEKLGKMTAIYTEDSIRTLDWKEHIRKRPGMYIGKLGDGSSQDDGIYVLLKEVMDNSIDEFMMGYGKTIEIEMTDNFVRVRDYGRGITLGKLMDVASKMNTGAKYDSKAFKKSVGLNGVGIKAVNALSTSFKIEAFRDGERKCVEFANGEVISDEPVNKTTEKNGTLTTFVPDKEIFGTYHYIEEYVVVLIQNYVFLNSGLTIKLNGQKYFSENGLRDLLDQNMSTEGL